MTRFLQIHLLTAYPPSNLNRDDLGRPKTAIVGGTNRLRISSQSLKRAWRTSNFFKESLSKHIGIRTRSMGKIIFQKFLDRGVSATQAKKWTVQILGTFGKVKKGKENRFNEELEMEQLVHFSHEEEKSINTLIKTLTEQNRSPNKEELFLLRKENSSIDIALFGRMLAENPYYNFEAAAQVAHAFTIQKIALEDDFFTAVDDLNIGSSSAGHIGNKEFSSGIFYLYICIDKELLLKNLNNNTKLAVQATNALTMSASKVCPGGHQNSFGHYGYAMFLMSEIGNYQPRSLAAAFFDPIKENYHHPMIQQGIDKLFDVREKIDNIYEKCAEDFYFFDVMANKGSLKETLNFQEQTF